LGRKIPHLIIACVTGATFKRPILNKRVQNLQVDYVFSSKSWQHLFP